MIKLQIKKYLFFAVVFSFIVSFMAIADTKTKQTDSKPKQASAKTKQTAKDEPQLDIRLTGLVSTILLKVINPVETREKLLAKTAKVKGFPTLITDDSIELKIPPEKLSLLLSFAGEQGLIIEKTLEREDLTQKVAQLEGQLKSKIKILTTLRGFFNDSNVVATLRIEQTMTDLVSEIENVKGELRVLKERSTWAKVLIKFNFEQRDRIIYVTSPFEWLNSVSLSRFLEDF